MRRTFPALACRHDGIASCLVSPDEMTQGCSQFLLSTVIIMLLVYTSESLDAALHLLGLVTASPLPDCRVPAGEFPTTDGSDHEQEKGQGWCWCW